MSRKKKIKALILFSGGLDSILAAKILMTQNNIKATGVTFTSLFFGNDTAKIMARQIGLKLKSIDFSKEHLGMLKNPHYGYGKNMNPCLDCHILMLKFAKKIMEKEKYDIVATGEVLGERPMSQNKRSLELIAKASGLKGCLLRPLSARLLEPTILEKNNLIDRGIFLSIEGRCRKPQLELAKKFKIKNYPTPAGGCLLTDLEFGKKLKELLERFPKCAGNDVELLKYGRHFWQGNIKVVIGRNHGENLKLKKISRKSDILMELKFTPGPTALVRGRKISEEVISYTKTLIIKYSKKAKENEEFNIIEIRNKI